MSKKRLSDEEILLQDLTKDQQEIIKKMLDIQDILDNPPNDKMFINNECTYLIEYIDILGDVEFSNYSDIVIQKRVTSLHNKIFKNRRL